MIAAPASRASPPQVVPHAASEAAPGFGALLDAAQPAAPPPAPAPEPTAPPAAEPDWQAHAADLAPQSAPADPAPIPVLLRRQEPSSEPLATEPLPVDADAATATVPPEAPAIAAPGTLIAFAATVAAPPSASRDLKPARGHDRRAITATATTATDSAPQFNAPTTPAPSPAPGPAAPAPDPSAPAPAQAPGDARLLAHQLGTAHDAAGLDRLAREIAATADGDARVRFALAPAALGHIDVELQRGDDGTAVRIGTASHASHAAIADARHQLLADAQAQGVRISRAHVELTAGGDGAGRGASPDDRRQPPRAPAPSRAPTRATEPADPARDARDLYA